MGKFTMKHYQAIADTIKDLPVREVLPEQHQGKLTYPAIHYFVLMDAICDMLAADNEKFDRKRFLKVAGCPYFSRLSIASTVIKKW